MNPSSLPNPDDDRYLFVKTPPPNIPPKLGGESITNYDPLICGLLRTIALYWTIETFASVVPILFSTLFLSGSQWSRVGGISWGLQVLVPMFIRLFSGLGLWFLAPYISPWFCGRPKKALKQP